MKFRSAPKSELVQVMIQTERSGVKGKMWQKASTTKDGQENEGKSSAGLINGGCGKLSRKTLENELITACSNKLCFGNSPEVLGTPSPLRSIGINDIAENFKVIYGAQ